MSSQIITEAPKYIPVLLDEKGFWVQVALALITFLAVIVAIFQEKIREIFNRSKLNMTIILSPPDCHKIALTNPETGALLANSIYIRIRVKYLRGDAAENCEVMALKFWTINEDGSKEEKTDFLPLNLVWSHFQPRRINTRIGKKMFRHCDFGFFAPLDHGQVILKLDTMVNPNPTSSGNLPNVIRPGVYEFELLLSGDNVEPFTKKWKLEFDGRWVEDEHTMLTEHIKIEELL